MLINSLKQHGKVIGATGEKYGDYFAITDVDLVISINSWNDIIRKSSHIILERMALVVDALEYSRHMYENMRRYLQYQLTVGVNLTLFMVLGGFFYKELPLAPSTILWINYLMDTMAALIFASVYPERSSNSLGFS